jgi:hypothetical protein
MNDRLSALRSPAALALAALLAACSSDNNGDTGGNDNPDAGNNPADAQQGDTGNNNPPDSGEPADTGGALPDTGENGGMDGGTLPEGVAPPRRGDMAFAVDPATQRTYMFFGDRAEPMNCGPAASDFMDDGWMFDATTNRWSSLPVNGTAPLKRARASAVWDKMRNRFIMFGGRYRAGTMGNYTFLKDVWAYDPANGTWTELFAQDAAGGPSGRMNTTVLADPDRDRIIVHAGGTTNFTAFTVDSETWAFSLADNTWSQIGTTGTLPTARIFHMAALDRMRGRLFVFGGAGEDAFTATEFFRDLWYLDFANDTWTQVPISGEWPTGRIKGVMEYDEGRDQLVLFAGHDDTSLGNTNDVWTLDLANLTWMLRKQGDTFNNPPAGFCDFPADFATVDLMSPERRESHLFVIVGDTAIMYGGRTDCGLSNDTWKLNLMDNSWDEITRSFNGMTCFRSGRTNCDQAGEKMCG